MAERHDDVARLNRLAAFKHDALDPPGAGFLGDDGVRHARAEPDFPAERLDFAANILDNRK